MAVHFFSQRCISLTGCVVSELVRASADTAQNHPLGVAAGNINRTTIFLVPTVTTYKDISQRYGAFHDARVLHFRRLQSEAAQLCQHYEQSLELPRSHWQEPQGETHSYVHLGRVGADGKFQPSDQFSLLGKATDNSVDFAILLTLEKAPELHPKIGYVIPLNVKSVGQVMRFKLIESGHEFEVTPTDGEQRYAAICSAISQEVMKEFDPALFNSGQAHF